MMKDDLDLSLSRDIRKLFVEFCNAKEFYKKAAAYRTMQIFRSLFSSNQEVLYFYQEMENYIRDNSRLYSYDCDAYDSYFDEYIKNNYDFFENNLPFFSLPTLSVNYRFSNLSNYDIAYLVESFFWKYSHGLYRFYKKMSNENKLLFRNPLSTSRIAGMNPQVESGFAFFASLNHRRSYTYVNKLKNLVDLSNLVHEIGHAYFFHLTKYSLDDTFNPEKEILVEIPSRMLEFLFILYLRKLNIEEADILLQKFFVRAFYERKDKNLTVRYKYTLGNVFAMSYASLIGSTISLDYFYKVIYKENPERLIEDTCQYVVNNQEEIQKKLIK